jgi:hypothetical protein
MFFVCFVLPLFLSLSPSPVILFFSPLLCFVSVNFFVGSLQHFVIRIVLWSETFGRLCSKELN